MLVKFVPHQNVFVVVGQENYDKFVDMVVKHFKSAKWGDPMDQATT